MAKIRVAAERTMAATPERVYEVIANYREHHPRILPPAFSGLTVEEGGIGAGTVARFNLKAGGRTRGYRVKIEEPQPGRVLVERDLMSELATTFTVTPEGRGSRVGIETVWQGAGGFGGLMERLFAPGMLKKLYADELNRLEAYAARG